MTTLIIVLIIFYFLLIRPAIIKKRETDLQIKKLSEEKDNADESEKENENPDEHFNG